MVFLVNSFVILVLRGNEVSMDIIDFGNSEFLVCGVFFN